MGLILVALGCARDHHLYDETQFWYTLFQNSLLWYHAITTEEDRSLYLRAVNSLWSSLGCPTDQFSHADVSCVQTLIAQDYNSDSLSVWDRLRNGLLINACIDFLDGKLSLTEFCVSS